MMYPLLQLTGVSGGYKKGVDVLHGVCLTMSEGEAVGIIGLNGSGKSTLGKAMMNLLPYRSGDIAFMGELLNARRTLEISRGGMVMMKQGGSVFRNLTVRENIRLAFERNRDPDFREQLSAMVRILSDPAKAPLTADRLSGGERQALSLAMTLAGRPRLVILDEPSAGLSPADQESTFQMLQKVRDTFGVAIILIEQNIAGAVDFCDRSLLLESGQVIAEHRDKDIKTIEKQLFKNK